MKHVNKYLCITMMAIIGCLELRARKVETKLPQKSYKQNIATIKEFQALLRDFKAQNKFEKIDFSLLMGKINTQFRAVDAIVSFMTGISRNDRYTLSQKMAEVLETIQKLTQIRDTWKKLTNPWQQILTVCQEYEPIEKTSIFTFITTTRDLRDGVNGVIEAFNTLMQQLKIQAEQQQ